MKNLILNFALLSLIVVIGILSAGCQTTRAQRIEKYKSVAKEAVKLGIDLSEIYLQSRYGLNLNSDEIIKQIIEKEIQEKENERKKREQEQQNYRSGNENVLSGSSIGNTSSVYDSWPDVRNFKIINEFQEENAMKLLKNYGLNRDNMFLITENFKITNFNNSGAWVDLTAEQVAMEEGDHNFKRALVFIAFKKVDDNTLEIIFGADQGGGNYNQNIGKAYNEADYLICYWVRRGQVKGRSQLYKV